MSHSDLSILEQMRETSDYKLGYVMSSMRTVLFQLEKGNVDEAIREIHNTLQKIKTTNAEV